MKLRSSFESGEAHGKPVTIWSIFGAIWRVKCGAAQTFQSIEHWTIVPSQQAIRDMQLIIWVNTNQMGIERSVMKFRKWNPVRDDGLTEPLVLVLDDVRSIQQERFWNA